VSKRNNPTSGYAVEAEIITGIRPVLRCAMAKLINNCTNKVQS